MGQFIGHAGGFLLLSAVVLLVGIFTAEVGIVKDRDKLRKNGFTALYVCCIGILYYFIMAYVKNTASGQTNMFDFDSVFTFCGLDKDLELYGDPSLKSACLGLGMPIFPFLVHILGKIIFEQYGGIAVWLNFLSVAVGICCLYRMMCEYFEREISPHTVMVILSLPFAFMLFTPGSYGWVFGLLSASAYALYKGNTPLWLILGIIAALSNKLGILFVLPLILSKTSGFSAFVKKVGENKLISNAYVRLGYLFLMFSIDGAILFLTIGGVNL